MIIPEGYDRLIILRKAIPITEPLRKQCTKCRKTFYQSKMVRVYSSAPYGDVYCEESYYCPHCNNKEAILV